MLMNLLDKFETVTVKADVRITPEDKAFCEAHQAAYDAAVQAFQELAFFWEDMENTQKELLGGSDTSYLSSRDGPEISQRQINKHLEHLHRAVVYNIVHYFNSTYHVSVSADHVANNLLPQKPDLRIYENKEAHDAYHEKLRAAKIRYEDVVDQIILLLDGRSFAEQAFHELAEKCHKAAWNLYKNRPEYERKKALITFNGYFCTNHHYSWQDEWTLEDKMKDILRGVAHYETGSFSLYPLGFSELLFSAHAQPYAWRAAWTRSLEERERVRFPEGVRLGEDAAFLFTLYPVAHGIELISDKLYRYRMVGGSLTHALDDPSVLARKVAQHLGAFEAIFAEWSRRGLESLCPAQMVTWCLDMTAFDLVRLPAKEGAAAVARLAQTLADVYGEAWAELPRQKAVRRTARRVADAAAAGTGLTLGKIDIVRFFLATRGLRACVQRVLR